MPMASINFRNNSFGVKFNQKLASIHKKLAEKEPFLHVLSDLYTDLSQYFKSDVKRANDAYSQLIQNIIYYICHNLKPSAYRYTALRSLIDYAQRERVLFYTGAAELSLWIDPQEKYTILHSISSTSYVDLAALIVKEFNKVAGFNGLVGKESLLNYKHKENFTALNIAAFNKQKGMIIFLLEQATEDFGGKQTPLYWDFVTNKTAQGFSAIYGAFMQRDAEVAELLFDDLLLACDNIHDPKFQALIFSIDDPNYNLINGAARCDAPVFLQRLFTMMKLAGRHNSVFKQALGQRNEFGYTALHSACKNGYIQNVRILLKEMINVFADEDRSVWNTLLAQDDSKKCSSVLQIACYQGLTEIAALVLSEISKVMGGEFTADFRDFFRQLNNGFYLFLHSACESKNADTIAFVLERSARIFGGEDNDDFRAQLICTNTIGNIPLQNAINTVNVRGVALILQAMQRAFANVDQTPYQDCFTRVNAHGYSLFHAAVCTRDIEIVRLICNAIYDSSPSQFTNRCALLLTQENDKGYTVINSAAIRGDLSMLRFLTEMAGITFGQFNTPPFQELISHKDHDGFSPLLHLSKEGHIACLKFLIAVGWLAFVDIQSPAFINFFTVISNKEFSALNTSSKEGHIEVVEFLLQVGELVFGGIHTDAFFHFLEKKNGGGFTPLNAVCNQALYEERDIKVPLTLLAYGADPDKKNKRHYSARQNTPQKWEHIYGPNTSHAILPRLDLKRPRSCEFFSAENTENKRQRTTEEVALPKYRKR